MREDNFQDRETIQKIGSRLIALAWIVEALAALVALTIALMTGYSIFEEMHASSDRLQSAIIISVVLGGLPFLMVAVVEITKIPLVLAYFHARQKRWKILFGASLVFLIITTFETALNGFERNFSNLNLAIDIKKREINRLDEQIIILNSSIDGFKFESEAELRRGHRERAEALARERAVEISEQDRRADDRRSVSQFDINAINQQISVIEQRIADLQNQRTQQQSAQQRNNEQRMQLERAAIEAQRQREQSDEQRRREESQRLDNEASEQRRNIEGRIRDVDIRIARNDTEESEELKTSTFFTESRIRERFRERRQSLQDEKRRLEAQLAGIATGRPRDQSSPGSSSLSQQANQRPNVFVVSTPQLDAQIREEQGRLAELQRQRSDKAAHNSRDMSEDLNIIEKVKKEIADRYNERRQLIERELDEGIRWSQASANRRDELIQDRRKIEEEKARLRNDVNLKVSDNQVYRIAQFFFAHENAADVSKAELRITGLVWFGSLALIVAATGTVLAIAGTLMKYGGGSGRVKKGLFRTIRSLIVDLRRNIRKPKVIEKNILIEKEKIISVPTEVPVDKVVFRDVPREIVRKELVYVPLYTNDPDLLGVRENTKTKVENATFGSAKIDKS